MRSLSDPRHMSRRLALSAIFCWLFTEPDMAACMSLSKESLEHADTDYDPELTDYLVNGVKKYLGRIDEIIVDSAPEWPIDKIAKVDLVILRIAVFELVFGKKAPSKVVVDECVELAKEYGNDTSHKFVNGVLGAILEKQPKQKE